MLAVHPLAHKALAVGAGSAGQPSAFQTLVQSADAAGQYLVEIAAYKGDEIRLGGTALLAGGAMLGRRPLAATPPSGASASGEVLLIYGDRHWTGSPTDADKPNEFYEGRVTVPLVMDRAVPIAPEESPRIQRQIGSVEIANGDGALDAIVQSYAVDGRQVRVLFGPLDGAYADFGVIADVLGTGWEAGDLTARLLLRDRGYALDLPLQSNLYAGGGGANGTDEIKGKPIPLSFGRLRNITPTLIDPTNLVWQWHDGKGKAVDDVFDQGAALTLDTAIGTNGDVADYAALIAASIAAGKYVTCLALGLFRTQSTPAGLLTADVRGDATPDYQNTVDTIALRILRSFAGIADKHINAGSFAGLGSIGGELGLYLSSDARPTTGEVLDILLGGAGGWWGGDRLGRIRAGRLVKPEDQQPVFFFDDINVLRLEPEPNPIPHYRQRVAYKPNWTEQRGEDLAASVTAARRQFLTETERVATTIDTSIRVRHPQALDPAPIRSLYELETDAQALSDNKSALHKGDRRIFRATAKRLGYLFDLGTVVRQTWPRLGLQAGRNFVIVGIREDADRDETTLRLWG